jgi:hypothetical protein
MDAGQNRQRRTSFQVETAEICEYRGLASCSPGIDGSAGKPGADLIDDKCRLKKCDGQIDLQSKLMMAIRMVQVKNLFARFTLI